MKKFLVPAMIFSLIFLSGCVNTPLTTHENEIPAQTQTETPNIVSEKSQDIWITIDPISNTTAGEILTFSGKTNLNVADEILVVVFPEWWSDVTRRTQCGGREIEGQAASGTIRPVPGKNTVNTWNFSIDTSTYPVQDYVIQVDAINQSASNRSVFSLIGNNSAQGSRGCQ